MSELRSAQYSFELLRSRIDRIEADTDARGLRNGQDSLSTRIRRFEEIISVHQVNDSWNRIVRLEASVGHGQVGESLRDCRVRVNQLEAGRTNLENRVRTQDWYHDLSEQESSDEIHRIGDGRPRRAAPKRRMIAQARVPVEELEQLFAQLRNDVQKSGLDREVVHKRITQFLAECQRRETSSRNSLEQRLIQLRHDFQAAMVEQDTSFSRIAHEFTGRRARREQLHQHVHDSLVPQLQNVQASADRYEAWLTEAGRSQDQFSNATCAILRSISNKQKHQRELIRNLPKQIEALQSGTHSGATSSGHNAVSEARPAEDSHSVMMGLADLRQKVTRLVEQVDQNSDEPGNLGCALPRLDLIEDLVFQT